MSQRTAYLWGPLSSFSGPLAAWLVAQGWHVHIATKSSLNLFSLSSLDLTSAARDLLEEAVGGVESYRAFHERLKLLEGNEPVKNRHYDALIFCGLPPNYDEARVPRAPWAAAELPAIASSLKGVPVFVVSSLWGAVQRDRVVPEELEFERRKPVTHWERICQTYELKLAEVLSKIESNWYFVRIPMMSGANATGVPFGFTGPSVLFRELDPRDKSKQNDELKIRSRMAREGKVELVYNPDSTTWFLPVDLAVYMFSRFLEDEARPRICNFVSTEASLNREWMEHLAAALGLSEIVQSDKDSLNLPAAFRKLLVDDVQVRTRNLFEVAGRYQLAPVRLDRDYFEKVVSAGRRKEWGLGKTQLGDPVVHPQRLASYYFEQFIPNLFTDKLLRKATTGGISIGFMLKDSGGLAWILKSPNGKPVVERLERGAEKPRICFNFSGQTMARLIASKLPLSRALLLREVEVEGPLLDTLRVTQALEKFLKAHPMATHEVDALLQEGAPA